MRFLSIAAACVCAFLQAGSAVAQDTRSVQDILDCVNARIARGLAEHDDFARVREYYAPPLYYVSGPSAQYDTWGLLLDLSKKPAFAYETYHPKHDLVTPTFRRKVSRDVSKAFQACDVRWRKKWRGVIPARLSMPSLQEAMMASSDN